MKKIIKSLPLLLTAALTFSSCSDDNGGGGGGDLPSETTSNGVFVCNQGSFYSGIVGSLSYIEYETSKTFNNVFYNANQTYIGDTFQSGFIYGDYIYLLLSDSHIIQIIDKQTYNLVSSISTQELNAGPRYMTEYNGMLYATLFADPGYVVEIDPATNKITRQLEIGNQPEYIVSYKNSLYVAVSDGYNVSSAVNPNSFIAVVNPTSMTISNKITGLVNPVQLATNGSELFVCSWGWYDSENSYSQTDYGIYQVTNTVTKICDGTTMALNGDKLYYISDPYIYNNNAPAFYGVWDITSGTSSQWIDSAQGVDYPTSGIGVDPVTGNVFVCSYELIDGWASYNTPGYVKQYTSRGDVVGTYKVGISPNYLFFNIVEQD